MANNNNIPPAGVARPDENGDLNLGGYWGNTRRPQDYTSTQQPATEARVDPAVAEAQRKWDMLHSAPAMTPEQKARAAKDGADIAAGKMVIDFDREQREAIDKQFTYSSPDNTYKSVETNVVGNGTNKSYTQGFGNNQAQTNNADISSMVDKINYMNKINGAGKAIDAQETAQKLYDLYGDKAGELLDKAIMEPTNYGTAAGAGIRTSREAVNHLKGIDKDKAKEFSENILSNPAFNKQKSADNTVSVSQNNVGNDDRRAADLQSVMDLAIGNPERYEAMKGMYQSIFAAKLPGVELAQYFLDIMKEVEANMAKVLESQQIKRVLSNSAEAAGRVNSDADKKREEDKLSCRELYKDNEKFAKAKETYQGIANNGTDAERAKAQYYLGIMNEVEQEGALKNTLTNDSKAAGVKMDKVDEYIASIGGQFKEIAGNTAQNKNQINVFDMMRNNAKQNGCF